MTRLTPRQHEILMLISEEFTTGEIASKLGLAIGTVEVHRKALFKKMNAKNVAGLMKKACMAGYFSSEA